MPFPTSFRSFMVQSTVEAAIHAYNMPARHPASQTAGRTHSLFLTAIASPIADMKVKIHAHKKPLSGDLPIRRRASTPAPSW